MRLKSLILFLFAANIIFAQTYPEYEGRFMEIRSMQDTLGMKELITNLESETKKADNADMDNLLAECYFEYGLWGKVKNSKSLYEKGLNTAEKGIRRDDKNGKAYYIASMASAQLIPMSNIFGIIKLGRKFMQYMPKAVEFLDDSLYKGFALMGSAVGYMSPPAPFHDYNKSEEYYEEAAEYVGDYPGLYLYKGILYMKIKNKEKAKNMFEKVISMDPHPLFIKAHEDDASRARELLEELGY